MKRRDEIEDEILDDEEEFLDDEEILDDDEIIDDEEEEEEDYDEKPKKKAKKVDTSKGGKKKMGKGAKAAIIASSVVAVLAVLVVLAIYVVFPLLSPPVDTSAGYQGLIGNTKPTGVTTVAEVNKNMSAYEMLAAALKNYDNAEYTANVCMVGGVATKIGPLAINQAVKSSKIRIGKATDKDVQYFGMSTSYGFTAMSEEYYTTGLSSKPIKYRKASKIAAKTGDVSAWGSTEEYANLDAFKAKKSTDFTKIWSYDVSEKTVTPECLTTKPEYDSSAKCYYFKIAVDIENPEAVKDYKEVMTYQLSSNMGADVTQLDFTKLQFEIAVWDNGFIRYIGIEEAYVMTLNMKGLEVKGMTIENTYMNEYTYNKDDAIPYTSEEDTKAYTEYFKMF